MVLQPLEIGTIPLPEAVAKVIIGNLLRNAFHYTHCGSVVIEITANRIRIDDTGVGFGYEKKDSNDNQGFGIGLSLVERLSQHFNLTFQLLSKDESTPLTPSISKGTIAEISWPQ